MQNLPSKADVPGFKRRAWLQLASLSVISLGLTACGFRLRGSQKFVFSRIAIGPVPGGGVAQELRRSLGSAIELVAADSPAARAQLVLDVTQDQREKIVVGLNATGQVREFQLRMRVRLRLRTAAGKTIIEDDEILQQRDISFNESAVLAKEAEEALLYRDMQTDIVQQILRRLAMIQAAQLD
jgi:LPS-assembly lipoprotein